MRLIDRLWIMLVAISMLALVGCGKGTRHLLPAEAPAPSIIGTFGPSQCFYNPEASRGFGSAVYSIISVTFAEDLSGVNSVALYPDDVCSTPLFTADIPFTYDQLRSDGEYYVIDQGANGAFIARLRVSYEGLELVHAREEIRLELVRQ